MTSTHGFARVCGLVLLAAAVAAPALAQDFRGAITGRVTDTSNAVLPGATVTATNIATNQPTSSVTNSDGVYNLLFLTPGIYNVVDGAARLQEAGAPAASRSASAIA